MHRLEGMTLRRSRPPPRKAEVAADDRYARDGGNRSLPSDAACKEWIDESHPVTATQKHKSLSWSIRTMSMLALSQAATRPVLRVMILIACFGLFYGMEQFVGSRGAPDRIDDLMHDLFTPINGALQVNPRLADASMIAITGLADIAGVGLAVCSIFSRSVRPIVGLVALYGMRQTVEVLCELPVPAGMIWHYPGFPSLLVDYRVVDDFYFSGHTAMVAYATAELAMRRHWWLAALGAGCTLFVAIVLLSLRAHYTMDVFSGVVAALLAVWTGSRVEGYLERRRATMAAGGAAASAPSPPSH